jgi:NADPH:quinone reductase-like Zn-dependent oxidoreductase
MDTMKAAIIYEPGGPEVLKIESRPIPKRQAGEVLIRVKAFGLNRSELFTRQGLSPGVVFPQVLGIEAVGLVEDAPGGEFTKGDIVATAIGGMGRNFRRRIRRVHPRAGNAGAGDQNKSSLGDLGRHS